MTESDNAAGGERFLRESLLAALRQPNAEGGTAMDRVLAALIEKAAGSDLGAIKEIFDRLAGRPGQAAGEPEPPRKLVFGWKNEGFS